jgi:branched-chain amino acid transport system permease protein
MNKIFSSLGPRLAPAGAWLGDKMQPVLRVLGFKSVKYPLRTIGVLLLYALPILHLPLINTEGSDFSGVLFTVGTYVLVAIGLNIVIGYAGLLDLGYVGFYAVGAYTVGVITSEHGQWPFFLALPLALFVTMISGVLLGAPTLRVRGDYLAIVTMGFGEIIRIVARNTDWLGGAGGINSIPAPPDMGIEVIAIIVLILVIALTVWGVDDRTTKFLHFGVLDATPYFWMILTTIILVICADMLIKNSRVGRAWEATREDEDVAELMGVPTFKFKLLAFAMGACIGGLAGAMYATRVGFINPPSFPLMLSLLFVAAVVIGGAGNRWGAILGAVIVAYLPERFREFADWRLLVFGVALIAIVSFRTQGLFPGRQKKRVAEAEKEVERLEVGADGV